MTEPTQPSDGPAEPKTVPASPYSPGTARRNTERWYVRAGRKAKRGLRKALLPAAIAIGAAGIGYAAFEFGRQYELYTALGGLEETLLEQKTEVRVTRKYGKLYYHQKSESKRVIDPSALRKQLIDNTAGYNL